jgi:hypothetical protein
MKIITNRKIITSNKATNYSNACGCSGFDSYSNLNDTKSISLPSNVSQSNPTGQKKAGMLWDKTKGTWIKASDWLNANPQFKLLLTNLGNEALQNVFGGAFANLFTPIEDKQPAKNVEIIEEKKSDLSPTIKVTLLIIASILLVALIVNTTKEKK